MNKFKILVFDLRLSHLIDYANSLELELERLGCLRYVDYKDKKEIEKNYKEIEKSKSQSLRHIERIEFSLLRLKSFYLKI